MIISIAIDKRFEGQRPKQNATSYFQRPIGGKTKFIGPKVKVKVTQLCLIHCDSVNCNLQVSSVCGILQSRILEWVAVPFSRGSSASRDRTQVSHIAGGFFTIWVTRESQYSSQYFAMHSSRGSFQLKDQTMFPTLQANSLPSVPPGKPKNTGVVSLSFLQGIFLTQESNCGLLHHSSILYQPSYQGSPEDVQL